MFDHLLESSRWDDSNKWSNIGFGKEITQVELIEVSNKWSNIGFGEEIGIIEMKIYTLSGALWYAL